MSDTEVAWAAGLWDGEGSAGAYRMGQRLPIMKLSLSQTNQEIVDRFFAAIGHVGRVYGPYPPHNTGRQPFWIWQLVGARSEEVMDRLWPYLSSPKRLQYDAAVQVAWQARTGDVKTCTACGLPLDANHDLTD